MGEERSVYVSDDTLSTIMEWKDELIEGGRVNDNIQFGLIPNCCS